MKLLEVLLALFLTQIFVSFALNEREADQLDTSPEVLKNLDQEEKWMLAGVEVPDMTEKGDDNIQRFSRFSEFDSITDKTNDLLFNSHFQFALKIAVVNFVVQ